MFDTKTLAVIKTIPVQGGPDGIFFEPFTNRVYVLSHSAPHVTAINTADGTHCGHVRSWRRSPNKARPTARAAPISASKTRGRSPSSIARR